MDRQSFLKAPKVNSTLFLLEKKNGKHSADVRKKHRIKVIRVEELFSPNLQDNIPKLFRHPSEHADRKEYSDKYNEVYESATLQGDLTEKEWHLFVNKKKKKLNTIDEEGKPLEEFCTIHQGLLIGADSSVVEIKCKRA